MGFQNLRHIGAVLGDHPPLQPFHQPVVRQLQIQGEQRPLFFVDAVDLRFQALNTLLGQREGQKVGVV